MDGIIVKNRINARYLKSIYFLYQSVSEVGNLTNFYVFFSRDAKQLWKSFVKTHGFLKLIHFSLLQSVSDALRPDMDSHPDTLIGSNIFDGLIRHDRLLTDSLNLGLGLLPPGQGLASEPPVVKTEHSYSMAGSDGDSIPDSPLSFTDTGKHNL